jgi:hypothetical protein
MDITVTAAHPGSGKEADLLIDHLRCGLSGNSGGSKLVLCL